MRGKIIPLAIALALVAVACSSGNPTASDEYEELERELARAEAELASVEGQLSVVTAERDTLVTMDGPSSARYENAVRIHEEIIALLHDPGAFGTEEEVADLLADHATDDAKMDDEVFGSVNYRQGFCNTLYAGAMEAKIEVFEDWLTEDGSQGGFLWMWHGTNAAGNPFSLAGISLTTHDETGRISYEFVTYPYPDDYVDEAIFGGGT